MSIFNILVNAAIYVSIPIAIRYAILHRPIQSRWITVSILVPLFIVFATLIGIQREEGQKKISHELGLPYRSTPHMIGSPILYGAMIVSYFILRGGRKRTEIAKEYPTATMDDMTSSPNVCSACNAEVSSEAVYCHKCGNKIIDGDKGVS